MSPAAAGRFLETMNEIWYFCLGIFIDGNFMEHTCKKRDNCRYYQEDIFVKYKYEMHNADFLICNEDCKYYTPRREEQKCELSEEQDIFNI